MRRFTTAHALLLVLLLGTIRTPAVSAHAAGRPCFRQYHATCYRPSEVASAEHTMVTSPVNPAGAVTRATRLPLVQVVVERTGAPREVPNVITYSFGLAIALDRPMPRTSRPAMFVTEFALPRVRPYNGVKPQPGTIPSVLATFPRKKLALLVAGRFPLPTLRKIALAVLGK